MLASIQAIYNYDNSIFDGLRLPTVADIVNVRDLIDNPPVLNKDTLIANIILTCAELSLVYPDPQTIREAVRLWTNVNFHKWCELYSTMLYKYNPIWNKDGSYTDERQLSRNDTGSANSSGTSNVSGDLRHNVTGYDTNAYSPNTQEVTDNSSGYSSAGSTADNRAETEKTVHTEQGNIGVTTTQQMIIEQRNVVEFNLYDYITQDFKRNFCVMVY